MTAFPLLSLGIISPNGVADDAIMAKARIVMNAGIPAIAAKENHRQRHDRNFYVIPCLHANQGTQGNFTDQPAVVCRF